MQQINVKKSGKQVLVKRDSVIGVKQEAIHRFLDREKEVKRHKLRENKRKFERDFMCEPQSEVLCSYVSGIIKRYPSVDLFHSQSPPIAKCGDLGRGESVPFLKAPFDFFACEVSPQGPFINPVISMDEDARTSLSELSQSIQNAKVTLKMSTDTEETVEKILQSILKVCATIPKVEHKVTFPDSPSFGGVFDGVVSNLSPPVIAAIIVALAIAYYKGLIDNTLAIGAFVAYCTFKFGLPALGSLLDIFSSTEEVKPQSFSSESFASIISGICNTCLVAGSTTKIFDVKPMYSLINACSKVTMGIKPIVDLFFQAISYIRYCIAKYVFDDPMVIFRTGYEFLDLYLDKYNKVRLEFEDKTLHANDASLDVVRNLIADGEQILLRLPSSRETMTFKFRINESLSKLEIIKKDLLATNFKYNGIRQEPVGILMRGSPGCGKSLTMQHLAHAIAARTFTEDDLELYKQSPWMFVYNRQAETVYWEGYNSTKRIMFLDDILQARDVAGNPDNEIMNVIRAINVFENQLHCAAMESKGNTTFRSHFVIANTNAKSINLESINDKGAFMRRWDVVVDVCPKEQYCVDPKAPIWGRKVDFSLLPTRLRDGVEVTDLNPDILEFHQQVLDRGQWKPNGVIFDFDGFVELSLGIYSKKTYWNDIYMDTLNETLAKYERIMPQVAVSDGPMREVSEELMENLDPLFACFNYLARDKYYHVLGEVYYFYTTLYNEYNIQVVQEHWDILNGILVFHFFDKTGLLLPGAIDEDFLRRRTKQAVLQVLDKESMVIHEEDQIIPQVRSSFDKIKSKLPPLEGIKAKMYEYFEILKGYFPLNSLKICLSYIDKDVLQTAGIYSIVGLLAMFYTRSTVSVPYHKEVVNSFNNYVFEKVSVKGTEFSMSPESAVVLEPQSGERVVRARRARVPVVVRNATPQSIAKVNTNAVDLVHSLSRKNVMEFWAPVGRDSSGKLETMRFGFAMGICGTTIIFPYHFMSQLGSFWLEEKKIKDDDPIVFKRLDSPDITYTCTISEFFLGWCNVEYFEKHEIAIVKLGRACAPFRNISHLFVPESRLGLYGNVDAILSLPFDSSRGEAKEMLVLQAYLHQCLEIDAVGYESYTIQRTFAYRAPCSDGDCGAVLYADDPKSGTSILGIHVAGVSSRRLGFSTILTKEMMERVLLEAQETYVKEDQYALKLQPTVSLSNQVGLGLVEPHFSRRSSGETKLRRSVLYGKWKEPLTAPAALRPERVFGVLYDPLRIANAKYGLPMTCIPLRVLEEARDSLFSMLMSTSSISVVKQVYSFKEAILGDGSGWFKSIPRVTSAGFPHTAGSGLRTKEKFFGKRADYTFDSQACLQLERDVQTIICKAADGIRLTHIFIDCEKDERRTLDKVAAFKTRMFSGAPSELLVAWRMYFGAFQKWITANSIDNGMGISINEFGSDWDYLARKILAKGDSCVGAGDFKSFDASEQANIHWMILDLINIWYGDDVVGNRVRSILWYEIVNSIHLNRSSLHEWCASLPSGHPATIFVNSMYVHLLFRIVWVKHYNTAAGFNEHVYLVATGDDNLYAVAQSLRTLWTEKFVQSRMLEIGLNYAPEDKSKELCEDSLRSIREVTFLKRNFVWEETYRRWIAPLSLDVLLEIPYWVKSGAATFFDTEVNLAVCVAELSLHSQEIFEQWRSKIIAAVGSVRGVRLPVEMGFHTVRRIVLSRGEVVDLDSTQPLRSASVWLRTLDNENSGVKSGNSLSEVIPFRVNDYCQDGVPAVQVISRNQNAFGGLVEPQSKKPTAVSNTNSTHESFPVAEGDGSTNAPISSAQGGDSFDPRSTARSTNDAVVEESRPVMYKALRSDDLFSPDTGITQEVRLFLAKPYLLNSGSFNTTDTVATQIYFQNHIFQTVTSGNIKWAEKLRGNLAVRGKLVFTLFVNGNRFQQGRYILAWCPDGGANFNQSNVFVAGHSANLCQTTQLPHVEIDVNLDTTAVLEVPFINCAGWALKASGVGNLWDIGAIMIRAYSPLVAPTGTTAAYYTLYVHMEEVEFKMPVVPQSRAGVKSKVVKRVPPVERETGSGGPVTSAFVTLGKAADILTGIPLISSVMGPVSWASGIGASVAAYFGWCKPSIIDPVGIMQRYILHKYNNADTWDTSVRLAVTDVAKVEEVCGFAGSDLDEMSLNYLASIPAWYTTFTWASGDSSGHILYNVDLCPRDFTNAVAYGANTITFPTPMSYVANFFAQYRGSIRLTFKLVKTEFHSGRLAVSFFPFEYALTGARPSLPVLADTEYLHREIVDVRMGNEFSFVFPYTSITPYRSLLGADRMYGTVIVHVVDTLSTPASVSSGITVLVEASAAPDMEFAYPRDILEVPAYCITPQSKANEIVSADIGGASNLDSLTPARCCIGERVMSLRQLFKRFNPMILSFPGAINNYFVAFPFSAAIHVITAGNADNVSEIVPDVHSVIASCYALGRGAMRYKFIDGTELDNKFFSIRNLPWATNSPNLNTANFSYSAASQAVYGGLGNGSNNMVAYTTVSGGIEAEFPFYNRMFAYPVADVQSNAGVNMQYLVSNTSAPRSVLQLSYDALPTSLAIWRAASEDASFGLFVSTPGFTVWQTHSS